MTFGDGFASIAIGRCLMKAIILHNSARLVAEELGVEG